MLVLTPAQRDLSGNDRGVNADGIPQENADGADKIV
jgi:hypothetical protein